VQLRFKAKTPLLLLFALTLLTAACGGGAEESELSQAVSEAESAEAGQASEDAGSSEAASEVPTFEEGTTMAEIQSEGILTVGTKFDQPLFGQANLEGVPEGFDVEIAKLVAEAIFGEGNVTEGENIEFIEAVSANREPYIQDGTVDIVVATYTINDTRKEVVDFAGPYYVAGQDIMVAAGNPTGITGVADLNGKRVCTVNGSTSLENVREQAPQANLDVLFDTYSQCADSLRQGAVDAVTTDNVILLGLIDANQGEFELVGNPFTEEPYGIGLAKGDDEFRDFINDVLEEAYDDGSWAEAFESTVGQVAEETPEPPPVDRY
jgi:glutamate transport system substrate-binding protein